MAGPHRLPAAAAASAGPAARLASAAPRRPGARPAERQPRPPAAVPPGTSRPHHDTSPPPPRLARRPAAPPAAAASPGTAAPPPSAETPAALLDSLAAARSGRRGRRVVVPPEEPVSSSSSSDEDEAAGEGGGPSTSAPSATAPPPPRAAAPPTPSRQRDRAALVDIASRLAASEPRSGRVWRCGLCGGRGHNRLRCPVKPDAAAAERAAHKARRAAALAVGLAPSKPSPIASRSSNTSRFRGVSLRTDRGGGAAAAAVAAASGAAAATPAPAVWRAQVWDAAAQRVRFLGFFEDEEDAARAHDAALLEINGATPATAARLNFPPPPTALAAPLPLTGEAMAAAAADAILRAWQADGRLLLRVDFPLPDEEDAAGGRVPGAEGSATARFAAARALAEATLRAVKAHPALKGRLSMAWVDRDDLVCEWVGDRLAALLQPTPEAVPRLRALAAEAPARPLLVFNPQWGDPAAPGAGRANLVSDFGLGRSAREAEAWVGAFSPPAFVVQRVRVRGLDLRVFHAAGGPWQTHALWPNGRGASLIGVDPARPSYSRLAELAAGLPGGRRGWGGLVLGGGGGGGAPEPSAPPPPPSPRSQPSTKVSSPLTPPSAWVEDDGSGGTADARDVRLDPVLQIARWFGSPSGTAAAPASDPPRQRRPRSPPPPSPTPDAEAPPRPWE